MSESLCNYIEFHRQSVEAALWENIPKSGQCHTERINSALRYTLFPGGKRWRPILTLLGAEAVGGSVPRAMKAACAMEYLHTSSIIFDDLPAMDDAPTRRGRQSVHVVYGESIALLAALAFFNESYALLVKASRENGYCEAGLMLIEEAANCIGVDGMIGGQAVDLVLKGKGQNSDALVSRNLKTTALMRLTMMAGAAVCGAEDDDLATLADYGESLGMVYQICDDLLDELGMDEDLGKPAGQDHRHGRSTYVAELGVEGARRLATSLLDQGHQSLRSRFANSPSTELLIDASNVILQGGGTLAGSAV